jgi:phospholipid/cholesterol/gamma-HCH transport system substrate-binding protein
MSRESHLELKVGSFVLLAALILSFFIASVSRFSFMEKGHSLKVIFTFANGLKDAAPVRLAGVEAGIVKSMEVFLDEADAKKTKVRVDIWVKESVQVPTDSEVTINQLGLLGEKYVEIRPGLSMEFFKENSVIIGKDPVPMEKVTEQVHTLADKLEVTVERINNGILSEKNKQSLEGTMAEIHQLVKSINKGQGTIGKFLTDEAIYKNLEELTSDLKVNPWKLLYRPKK